MNLLQGGIAALTLTAALAACGGGGSGGAPLPGAAGGDAPDRATAQITGAGATFIYPLIAKWSDDYNKATGYRINYQSIGSGGGIAQIKAGTVDFGSTDKPLPPEELAEAGLVQFPSAIGGVVPVVNLPGVGQGQMRFTGPLLADIYLGKIVAWNDPAIVAVNPGITLPATKINVVHRSDGSGTTFNWVNYLSKVSPEWQQKVGEGTSVRWPIGIGGKGNEGVAAYTNQIVGAIGYVELSYALQTNMSYAAVQNRSGNFIIPNADSFQAAAASADWANSQDFNLIITDAPGADAFPIAATNFILMYKQPKNLERSRTAIKFFTWAFEEGQPQADELHYVPLPAELVTQIEAYWAANIAL